MKLGEIDEICNALKSLKKEKIQILHKFIFDKDGDRKNRERIRNFPGFEFEENDFDFKSKLKTIDDTFSLNELITICNILNIPFDGTKPEISERILLLLCDVDLLSKSIKNSDQFESDSETEETLHDSLVQCKMDASAKLSDECSSIDNHIQNVSISFSDIESVISPFNAEAHENISVWVDQFECAAKLFNLSDLQKFIFAKRSLGGNALLFIKSELYISSWDKLKHALIAEFKVTSNSAQWTKFM